MTDKKKQAKKIAAGATSETEAWDYSKPPSEQKNIQELAPWKKWKAKPDLVPMSAFPPESGIGSRIAYCRGQLDNLSVEALARYTKNFDGDGVSRASIVRYEAGDSLPGARELRILCNAFWVPANWLLFGALDSEMQRQPGRVLLEAMAGYIKAALPKELPDMWERLLLDNDKHEEEKRQRWLDEARNPPKN